MPVLAADLLVHWLNIVPRKEMEVETVAMYKPHGQLYRWAARQVEDAVEKLK